MAFTYDTATDIGKVRLYLRDHDRERAAFSDGELQIFIDVGGDWKKAIAEGAKALLADRARFARVWSRGDQTVNESGDDTAGIEWLNSLIDRWGGGSAVAALPSVIVTHAARHPSDPRAR